MQNLKPFDLERALAGDPVVYRNGSKPRAIYYLKEVDQEEVQPVLSITEQGGRESHEPNGNFYPSGNIHSRDLFMATKKFTYYFASWLHKPGERMFISPKPSESEIDQIIEHWIKTGVQGVMKHEIEIEE